MSTVDIETAGAQCRFGILAATVSDKEKVSFVHVAWLKVMMVVMMMMMMMMMMMVLMTVMVDDFGSS